jgi:hypothetical protein
MNLTLWILLLGLLPTLAAVGVWYWRARSGHEEEAVYHFRCSGCQRRFRYRASQQGMHVHCPQCWRPLKVPSIVAANGTGGRSGRASGAACRGE